MSSNNTNVPCIPIAKEQRKDKSMCAFKYISKIFNRLSIICSCLGITLFGALLFDLTHLHYSNIKTCIEYAYYLVIAGAILFFFAAFLSLFVKDDLKVTNPILSQGSLGDIVLLDNDKSGILIPKKSDLKLTNSNKQVKQILINKDTSIADKDASRTVTAKQSETSIKSLPVTSSNILQHVVTSKQTNNNARALPPSGISCKTQNHADFSEKTRNMPSTLPTSMLPKLQTNKCKQDSSFSLTEKLPHAEKQLVPYERRSGCQFHSRNVSSAMSCSVPNFQNFLSANTLGNSPATEITATKKVTLLPGGVALSREEYQIRRTTFYNYPGGGVSSPNVLSSIFDYAADNKNRIPSSVFNLHQNQVSDVLTKFESMNILH